MSASFFSGECSSTGVGRFVWRINKKFLYASAIKDLTVIVPAGFLTDFASVPRFLWPIVPVADGVYDPAAVVHDFCVRSRKLLGISLWTCHLVFREALLTLKTPRWQAEAMYGAVCLANWLVAGPGDGSPPKRLRSRVTQKER